MFYIYAHYGINKKSDGTCNIFYIGKGCGNRAYVKKGRGSLWQKISKDRGVKVEIIQTFEDEGSAYSFEKKLISIIKKRGGCEANVAEGGRGGQSKGVFRSDGSFFSNIEIAAHATGNLLGLKVSASSISSAANGILHAAYGFAWSHEKAPAHPEDRYLRSSKKLGKQVFCSNGMSFRSATEAARFAKTTVSRICDAARRFDAHGYSECRGYHWSYKAHPVPQKTKSEIYKEAVGRKVLNSKGEHFDSVTDAARHYSLILGRKCYPTTIHACLSGRTSSAFGVSWWRSGENPKGYKTKGERISKAFCKKIVMDDEILFKSQYEAAEWIKNEYGYENAQSNISACARGKRRVAYGHYWRFANDSEEKDLKVFTGE